MNAIVILLIALLTITAKPVYTAETPTSLKALHVLNRLAFGPKPGDLDKVNAMGVEAYIQQQLHPETIAEPPQLTAQLKNLQVLQMTPSQLYAEYAPHAKQGEKPDRQAKRDSRKKAKTVMEKVQNARIMRAIESPRQLQEVMVDFWFNHFNIYALKGQGSVWTGAFEEQAIRPFALGRFRDLLGATAKHPAMLFYLDNFKNIAPGTGKTGKKKNGPQGINENYARELMELHTLGVDGGYTQKDVTTLAHILTGWTFKKNGKRPQEYGTFYFDAAHHDRSDKTFLGTAIRGGGQEEVEHVLDMLASHPKTAHYICYKLVQYFVSDTPDPQLVDSLAQVFMSSGGDIRAVLNSLFQSPQFWDMKNINSKFKTPYRLVISAMRASGQTVENYRPLATAMAQLGMPLYGCLTPDGYKNTQEAWLDSNSMLARITFATRLASGNLPINAKHPPLDAQELEKTLGDNFSPSTREALKKNPQRLRAGLILGSPEFMRY